VRRLFFALLLVNLAYFAWAMWVAPPPTVAPAEPGARLPPLKLVEEMPPSDHPTTDASPKTMSHEAQACLSLGPFSDVNNSAEAAALLKQKGFDPKQRAEAGDTTDGYWVYIGGLKSQEDTDHLLANLAQSGIRDALIMPATDEGRRVSLGLFSERARAQRRADSVRVLGLKPQIEERKLPGTTYWVDLSAQPGMTAVPLQDLFAQGVSSKIRVEPCPASAQPTPASAVAASSPAPAKSAPAPVNPQAAGGGLHTSTASAAGTPGLR